MIKNSKNQFYTILLSLSFYVAACNNATHISSKSATEKITLNDSLGIIQLSIPQRYDTTFKWVHKSDCGISCDEQKYRYQPKNLPIIMETGLLWKAPVDSVDRLTISRSMYLVSNNSDSADIVATHRLIKEEIKFSADNMFFILDSVQKINGRFYSIIAIEKFSNSYSGKVLATTIVKGNDLKFEWDLKTSKIDSNTKKIIQESIGFIESISID